MLATTEVCCAAGPELIMYGIFEPTNVLAGSMFIFGLLPDDVV